MNYLIVLGFDIARKLGQKNVKELYSTIKQLSSMNSSISRIHCSWLHQSRSIGIEGGNQKNTTIVSESEFHIEWAISGEF